MRTLTRRGLLETAGRSALAAAGGSLLGGISVERLGLSEAWAQGASGVKTITHWDLLNPNGKSQREIALREILTLFKERTGISIEVQTLPWQDLGTKLIAAVQAGNPPDSSRVNIYNLRRIVEADALANLDPYIKKALTPAEKQDFIVDFTPPLIVGGHKWSFQIEMTPKAMFIRKDWLIKAGMQVPKTWDQLVAVGKAFTVGGKWGYMFNGSKTQLNQVETIFQPQIEGRGGRLLDASGNGIFESKAAVRTYQFLSDCAHKYKITPSDVVAMTYDDVFDAFKGGRVGMIQEGSHRYQDIAKAVGEENLVLAEVPSDDPHHPSPSVITGWGFGIPRGSRHLDAAWEWMMFYSSPEAEEINAKIAGSIPSRKSVLQRPYFQSKEAAYMRWWIAYATKYGELVINVPTFDQLNEVMVDALQQVLTNPHADIKQVLTDAVKRYNQLLHA